MSGEGVLPAFDQHPLTRDGLARPARHLTPLVAAHKVDGAWRIWLTVPGATPVALPVAVARLLAADLLAKVQVCEGTHPSQVASGQVGA